MTNLMIHLPSQRLLDTDLDKLKAAILGAKVGNIMLRLRSFIEDPVPPPGVREFIKWCTANSIVTWYCRWFWQGSGWGVPEWDNIFNTHAYTAWEQKVRAELNKMWAVGHIVADIEPYAKENWANVFEGGVPGSFVKEMESVVPAHQIAGIIPIVNRPAVGPNMAHFSMAWKNWGTAQFRQEKRYVNSPVFTGIPGINDWFQYCVSSDGVKWNNSRTWTPNQIESKLTSGEKILIYTDSNLPDELTKVLEGLS